jgi:DNA repair protein RecO (recombination protein O)
VLTILSPERGKFSAAARGARGPKSQLAAVSQAFTLARFLLVHGRSLDSVTQAQIENAHIHIATDVLKTAWASYLCELCDTLPEHLPEETLFELLTVALARLDAAESAHAEVEIVGRWFEAHFMELLGYAPTLGRCVACGQKINVAAADATQQVAFSPQLGGTLCQPCAPRDPQRLTLAVQSLRALRRLERAAEPPLPHDLALSSGARHDLRQCLRRCLFLHLDARLKSLNFLDDVMAAQALHGNRV